MKPFALPFFSCRSNSFRDLFYAINSYVKKWKLIFLYIGRMDWGGARAFDQHSRNGGRAIGKQKLPARPGISPGFFGAFARSGKRMGGGVARDSN